MNVNTIDKIIKVNINGIVYGCKAVLPVMQKQQAGPAVYSLTKVAALELTACLAREYANDLMYKYCSSWICTYTVMGKCVK